MGLLDGEKVTLKSLGYGVLLHTAGITKMNFLKVETVGMKDPPTLQKYVQSTGQARWMVAGHKVTA